MREAGGEVLLNLFFIYSHCRLVEIILQFHILWMTMFKQTRMQQVFSHVTPTHGF